jgi:U3 small nucleolar RNA-associated protein 14
MAVSDLLNRRVRALPDEDEEVDSEASASESESGDEKVEESGSDLSDDSSEEDHDDEVRLPKPCARLHTFLRVVTSPTTSQMPRATKTRKKTRRTKTAPTAKTTCKPH